MNRSQRLLLSLVLAAWLGSAALLGSHATSSVADPVGRLSHRLETLAKPAVRSESPRAQARALSLPPHGAFSLLRDGRAPIVDVRVTRASGAVVEELRRAGATIIDVSPQYRNVAARVPPRRLRALAATPGVEAVTEELRIGTDSVGGRRMLASAAGDPECTGVRTEGVHQLRAGKARRSFRVDGSGVKVGILSDSFDTDPFAPVHEADDIASGDLPGPGNPCGWNDPVTVLDDSNPGGDGNDEGRAMAQVVHDLAPGAKILFATYGDGIFAFANNIRALADHGADVIVDDASAGQEPFFQDGPIDAAIKYAKGKGAVYFSSAGNNNLIIGGHDVSSWETPSFRGAGSCPTGVPGTNCMDFDAGAGVDTGYGTTLPDDGRIRLLVQWAQPWYGVTTDLDAYLIDPATHAVLASSTDDNPGGGTQRPSEFLSYTNTTGADRSVELAINKSSGSGTPNPRTKLTNITNSTSASPTAVEYAESSGGDLVGPAIYGHKSTAIAMAAVRYNRSNSVERYSSRGPVTHYFGPVDGTTPASPLSAPDVLSKPNVAATDWGRNTFFPPGLGNRFKGTSAAAAHAAGVAALQVDALPSASFARVLHAETSTARPVGDFGPNAAGAGLLNARAAVARLLPKISVGDARRREGDRGRRKLRFTVKLSRPSQVPVRVSAATGHRGANAGDYVPVRDRLRFGPGDVRRTVRVRVRGDRDPEPNEHFIVRLRRPDHVKIRGGPGVGTIVDDD